MQECKPIKSYATLADNLSSLDELDSLPLSINIARLDNSTGIEETLMMHKAKWHKTCYVMCNKTKVDRIRKKIAKEQTLARSTSPLNGRLRAAFPRSSHQSTEKQPICLFVKRLLKSKPWQGVLRH